ncbi:MAG: replicative DNA helicase [Clostridiales bacterium]|nr:replicative DNA helicase [Clostridiales bacterium]
MPQAPDNVMIQRVPPQSKDAEQAVLYCCLESQDVLQRAMGILLAEDFYEPAHKIIYDTIITLYSQSKSVDLITVGDSLRREGKLEKVGGMTYLSTIVDTRSLLSNFDEYVKIVRQKAQARRMIKNIDEILKMSYEGKMDINSLIELAIGRLSEMRDINRQDISFLALKDVLEHSLRDILHPEDTRAIKSHFSLVDHVTNGFRPGTLTIVAARPAMGKSAFVINIATNVALYEKKAVAFFSLEMSAKEIGNRILSSRCDIPTSAIQSTRGLEKDQLGKITSTLPALGVAPLYIDDHSGLNTAEMLTRCRELKELCNNELGMICIDYLQLMQPVAQRSNSSRQQEISEISRSLKLMAKELDVPIIALSQLSRESEKRDDHRPVLSDLRDSGAIEQDADLVMFIHRPEYYRRKEEPEEEEGEKKPIKPVDEEKVERAEIIIAKNRQGPTKTVYLSWNGSRTTFFQKEKERKDGFQGPSDEDAPPEYGSAKSDDVLSDFDAIFSEPSGMEFDEVSYDEAGLGLEDAPLPDAPPPEDGSF